MVSWYRLANGSDAKLRSCHQPVHWFFQPDPRLPFLSAAYSPVRRWPKCCDWDHVVALKVWPMGLELVLVCSDLELWLSKSGNLESRSVKRSGVLQRFAIAADVRKEDTKARNKAKHGNKPCDRAIAKLECSTIITSWTNHLHFAKFCETKLLDFFPYPEIPQRQDNNSKKQLPDAEGRVTVPLRGNLCDLRDAWTWTRNANLFCSHLSHLHSVCILFLVFLVGLWISSSFSLDQSSISWSLTSGACATMKATVETTPTILGVVSQCFAVGRRHSQTYWGMRKTFVWTCFCQNVL